MATSFAVTRAEGRTTLCECLRKRLSLPWSQVKRLIRQGKVLLNGQTCTESGKRLQPGQRIVVELPVASEEDHSPLTTHHSPLTTVLAPTNLPLLRYVDDHLVIVDKPPGLTTMRHPEEAAEFGDRARRFLPPTLADLLPGLLAKQAPGRPGRVRAVHRLDRDTSGLVVFARTVEAEKHLGRQFRAHSIERSYLAVVRGRAQKGRIESWLIRDRGDGRRGSSPQPKQGRYAVTHVQVLEALGDFTLVECRLETGRTHQVRIHLGEAGTPLCGEQVYDRPLHGRPLPDGSGAKRVALHAATLGLDHPATGQRVQWTSPTPPDLSELIERWRSR